MSQLSKARSKKKKQEEREEERRTRGTASEILLQL